jgi:hypothetical protein
MLVSSNGEPATINIETDRDHIVHWYVEGEPGSAYAVTISAPKNAEFQLTKNLGSGGKDFGGFTF